MSIHNSHEAAVGIDVGGTTIAAAPVAHDGTFLHSPLEIESPSARTSEQVICSIAGAALIASAQSGEYDISSCGISMPGPFDYKTGVSQMTHKFESIKGLPLGETLANKTGLDVYWLNDGDAFGIGAAQWVTKSVRAHRVIGITIGTGLGASFVEGGNVVAGDDKRTPPDGEIWNLPHEEGILENWVSGTGISKIYESITGRRLSAKGIAELARTGDRDATAVYTTMGQVLGNSLASLGAEFEPDVVVVGGNVARSFDLFAPSLGRTLEQRDAGFFAVEAPEENLAIIGAARYAASWHA